MPWTGTAPSASDDYDGRTYTAVDSVGWADPAKSREAHRVRRNDGLRGLSPSYALRADPTQSDTEPLAATFYTPIQLLARRLSSVHLWRCPPWFTVNSSPHVLQR
jgi:hypothetical protein